MGDEMSTIAPGALVRVRKFGDRAFVVRRRDELHPERWRVISKAVASDGVRRGELFSGMTVGSGDVVVVKPAPTYSPGTQVKFNGGTAEVISVNGDTVTLAIPPARFKTRAGDHLHVPPSQAVVEVADLVLETLGD
jgi:hypothetical protein